MRCLDIEIGVVDHVGSSLLKGLNASIGSEVGEVI